MTRKIQTTVLISLAIAATALLPTTASAGTYPVYQCHSGAGYAVAGGWTWGGNAYSGSLAGCSNAFRMNAAAGNGFQGLWWSTPALGAGLKFTNTHFHYMGGTGGQTNAYARYCAGSGTGVLGICDTYYAAGPLGTADTHVNVGCNIYGAWNDCNRIMFTFTHNSGTMQTMTGGGAHFWFNDVTFTINDPASPTAIAPNGGTLKPTAPGAKKNWNRGTVTTTAGGSDAQSGIKSVRVFVGGNTALQATQSTANCNYTTWQPCPVGSVLAVNASINTNAVTAALGDGKHAVTTRAVDTGDNVSDAKVDFYIDNTPPAPPSNVSFTPTGDPRAPSGQFDLQWTNTEEGPETEKQSGVATVVVDAEPREGQPNPEPVAVAVGADAASVTGLTVPARGKWNLNVRLVDAAGNSSSVAGPIEVEFPGALDNGSGGDPASAVIELERGATIRTTYNRRALVDGRLVDAAGNPIAGATINVFEQINVAGSKRQKVATITTNANGAYRYRPRATANKVVTFAYSPTVGSDEHTVTREVVIVVTNALRLKTKRRSVKRGKRMGLTGAILAKGMRRSVVVEIQVRDGRQWRTVATRRSSKTGKFAFRYRFASTGRFVFRARVRKSSDLPIAPAASRAVSVKVR